MCRCDCHDTDRPRRFRPVALLVQLAFLYLVLVLGGGTLKNINNPVAVEAGRLIHTVTFVGPTIDWADHRGFDGLAKGLRTVSHGIPIGGHDHHQGHEHHVHDAGS